MNISEIPGLNNFLDNFFELLKAKGIDVSNYSMDHVAYQASSSEDYDSKVSELSKFGEFFNESVIGGRRVGIIKVSQPIPYKDKALIALEVIEQKTEQVCDSG